MAEGGVGQTEVGGNEEKCESGPEEGAEGMGESERGGGGGKRN